MARPILHTPRILRTGSPLGLEAIRQVAPAVFASGAHDSRGPRYAYVPTIKPLETLLDNGWGVYEASQQRSRAADRDPYTKHMLRLRKLGDFDVQARAGDGVPEVIMINAHDGTAAYHLFAGYFKFVCSNGLMVGNVMGGFKVRHTIGPQTSLEVLAAGERTVTEKFPAMLEHIEAMKATQCVIENAQRMADKALRLRYGQVVPPFPRDDLLNCRREEDKDPTVWNMLNRIQENILNGGWNTRSTMFARQSAVRPVERVTAVAGINAGLWDEAIAIVTEVE